MPGLETRGSGGGVRTPRPSLSRVWGWATGGGPSLVPYRQNLVRVLAVDGPLILEFLNGFLVRGCRRGRRRGFHP